MLTARDTEMDEIKAVGLGINDYLSKIRKLTVRIMVSFLIAFYNFHLSSIVEDTICLIDMLF